MFTDSTTNLFQANTLSYISITMNSYEMCTISCASYPDSLHAKTILFRWN